MADDFSAKGSQNNTLHRIPKPNLESSKRSPVVKCFVGRTLLVAALAWTLAAKVESAPSTVPDTPQLVAAAPAPTAPVVAPDLPGAPTPAGRFHLHRPGTDIDGDLLTGSVASQVYVLKGNVVLHSDPSIDRDIAAASESTDPLTVTADEIDIDRLGFTYVAKGNVHFVQGTRSGHADLATLDEQTHTIDLIGNADVLDGDRRAAAAKMHYDMFSKDFHGAGNVRIYEPLPTPKPASAATPPPKHKHRLPF